MERKSTTLKEAATASSQTPLFSLFGSARTSTCKTVSIASGSKDQSISDVKSNAVVSKTSRNMMKVVQLSTNILLFPKKNLMMIMASGRYKDCSKP